MNSTETLTQERLKEVLLYNKETGVLSWRVTPTPRIKPGTIAGCLNSNGYWQIRVDYRLYNAHRLVWLYIKGKFPCGEIDHVNHYTTDNRIENLRDVTSAVNSQNKSMHKNNKTGCTGVCRVAGSKTFRVRIYVNGVNFNLGNFEDFNEAVSVRKNAERRYGFHANHGANPHV